jgi:hypothetical protein
MRQSLIRQLKQALSGSLVATALLAGRSGSRNNKVEAGFPPRVSISAALAACGAAEFEAAISGCGTKTEQRQKTITTTQNQGEARLIGPPFGTRIILPGVVDCHELLSFLPPRSAGRDYW